MARNKILVTGSSGYIASQILPALRERYDITLLDVKNKRKNGTIMRDVIAVDISKLDTSVYRKYFMDKDVVVHLAHFWGKNPQGKFYQSDYYEERVNLDMAYHVYQLSLEQGVRRVVIASSNHATDWYERLIHAGKMDLVGPWTKPLSFNFYGWAKEAYETMGFIYACGALGRRLEVVQIRIGAPREVTFRDSGSLEKYKRDLGAYISPRDLKQLFIKSIETSNIEDEYGVPFQIFYGVSNNTRAFWSIANARKVIGYQPEDDSELVYGDEISKYVNKGGRTAVWN